MLRRGFLACAAGAFSTLTTTGCAITIDRSRDVDPLPDAATTVDGTEVWDLRRRPTAESIGMAAGDDTAIYGGLPPRRLLLRLPEGTEVRLMVRFIAFSSILSQDRRPVSLVVKTAGMPLDDTVAGYASLLRQLGLPTDTVAEFRTAAARSSGTARVHAGRVSERFGDIELSAGANYSPHSESGMLALGGWWGRDHSTR